MYTPVWYTLKILFYLISFGKQYNIPVQRFFIHGNESVATSLEQSSFYDKHRVNKYQRILDA